MIIRRGLSESTGNDDCQAFDVNESICYIVNCCQWYYMFIALNVLIFTSGNIADSACHGPFGRIFTKQLEAISQDLFLLNPRLLSWTPIFFQRCSKPVVSKREHARISRSKWKISWVQTAKEALESFEAKAQAHILEMSEFVSWVGFCGKLSRGLTHVYNSPCYKHGVSNCVSNSAPKNEKKKIFTNHFT